MLAIAGGKGGSGKTTTTLGLARALDGPALAVDADCGMPNLHALAEVPGEPTIADADLSAAGIPTAAHEDSRAPGASVLPAPRDGTTLERNLTRLAESDGDVRQLVDCPAGAGPDAAIPLRVATGALLVSPLCAAALRDAAKTASMARTLGTPVVGAVLTRTRLAPDRVEQLLGCPVLAAVPEVDPPALGTDVVRAAYGQLASTLEERSFSVDLEESLL